MTVGGDAASFGGELAVGGPVVCSAVRAARVRSVGVSAGLGDEGELSESRSVAGSCASG